jgi:hypothetical protein
MTQQELLEAILDKTNHVRGGISSRDMDIVSNALDEREGLIVEYAERKFGPVSGLCAQIANAIAKIDAENNKNLKAQMDECSEQLFEARRKVKELQTGKKATTQYHGASDGHRGQVFDFNT